MITRKSFLTLLSAAALSVSAHGSTLLSTWAFDEEPGAEKVRDSTNTRHGIAADVDFDKSGAGIDGKGFGKAAVFNGQTSKIVFNPAVNWPRFDRGDFTVTGWFQLPKNEAREDRPLIVAGKNRNKSGWALQVGRADRTRKGQLFFAVGGAVEKEVVLVLSKKRVDDGAWHWFAAVVRDQVGHLYVDGVLQGSVPFNSKTSANHDAGEVSFGASDSSAYNGWLDHIQLYDGALSGVVDSEQKLISGKLYEAWQSAPASVH